MSDRRSLGTWFHASVARIFAGMSASDLVAAWAQRLEKVPKGEAGIDEAVYVALVKGPAAALKREMAYAPLFEARLDKGVELDGRDRRDDLARGVQQEEVRAGCLKLLERRDELVHVVGLGAPELELQPDGRAGEVGLLDGHARAIERAPPWLPREPRGHVTVLVPGIIRQLEIADGKHPVRGRRDDRQATHQATANSNKAGAAA